MRHAVVECRSERYLRVDGKPPPPTWDAIAGIYKTRDARFVRLHTNFRHHRDAVCKVLDCKPERDDCPGRADAVGRRGVRDRGLCRRWRGRDDALARRNGPICRTPGRWPRCPRSRSKKSARPRQNPGPRVDRPLAGVARARSVAGDRSSRRRPHAGRAWRRCAADFRSRSAGDSLAHHRHRPRQADEPHRTQERAGAGQLARSAGQCGYFLARLSSAGARSARLLAAAMRRRSTPASSMCRCRPMAMPGRGRNAAASIRWCRPRPASITPKGRPPASKARRNCRRKCSITPPAT